MRFIDESVLTKLKLLKLKSSEFSRLAKAAQGAHLATISGGRSQEFSEYKHYAQGDSTRHIDWKVYARNDRFFIKRFLQERAERCLFVLDSSASMLYKSRTATFSKWEFAARVLMGRTAYSLMKRDMCSLFSFSTTSSAVVPFSSDFSQIFKFDAVLGKVLPSGETLPLKQYANAINSLGSNSVLYLFSDLMVGSDYLERIMELTFVKKIRMKVFHILDSQEFGIPFIGDAVAVDVETGKKLRVFTMDIKKEYESEFKKWLAFCENFFLQKGMPYFRATNENSFDAVFDGYMRATEL